MPHRLRCAVWARIISAKLRFQPLGGRLFGLTRGAFGDVAHLKATRVIYRTQCFWQFRRLRVSYLSNGTLFASRGCKTHVACEIASAGDSHSHWQRYLCDNLICTHEWARFSGPTQIAFIYFMNSFTFSLTTNNFICGRWERNRTPWWKFGFLFLE